MIYLETSVALAQLFAEDRQPPQDLWRKPLTASRLLQYEVWARVHARRLEAKHGSEVPDLLDAVSYIELSPVVLARALEPLPVAVRTLEALHLATMEFLRGHGQAIELASYDERMLAAARALRIPIEGSETRRCAGSGMALGTTSPEKSRRAREAALPF